MAENVSSAAAAAAASEGGGGGGGESLKDQGNEFFKAGNYLKAAAIYTQAIKKDPSNATLFRHRGSKYSTDEDIALCKAVVMISEDGDTCAAKKKGKYWERILEKFQMFHENREGRNAHGINNRFCTISKEVLKYVDDLKHFHKNRASGWTELDVVSHARKEYESREKKAFAFEECYYILQVMPKYNVDMIQMNNMQLNQEEGGGSNPVTPTASGRNINLLTEGDQSSQPENNNTQPQPTTFVERPPRIEAQKRAKRLGDSSSASYESILEKTSSFIKFFKDAQAKKKLARDRQNEAMKDFVRLKEEEIDLKKRKEEDRIMAVDIESMPSKTKQYWETRQQEILLRRGLLP